MKAGRIIIAACVVLCLGIALFDIAALVGSVLSSCREDLRGDRTPDVPAASEGTSNTQHPTPNVQPDARTIEPMADAPKPTDFLFETHLGDDRSRPVEWSDTPPVVDGFTIHHRISTSDGTFEHRNAPLVLRELPDTALTAAPRVNGKELR